MFSLSHGAVQLTKHGQDILPTSSKKFPLNSGTCIHTHDARSVTKIEPERKNDRKRATLTQSERLMLCV